MTSATVVPSELERSFRRIAESQAEGPDAATETRHLTRQSLAAMHFVEAVGHTVRFDHARGAWFIWQGHRWHVDRTEGIRRIWLHVLSARYVDALGIGDGDMRQQTIGAIQAAGALDSAIEAGLRIAASSEPVAMAGDEWDPDARLLGCENGIIDLQTGQLRDGRPEDLITRSTGLSFDAAARAPRWERFLDEVFADDRELIDWFRRLIGASFVGDSKEILALHHGVGNNGKSVAYRTLGHVAGDYGVEIAIDTLIKARREAGAPTSDLMRLRGARLAFTSEPDQAAKLNGGTLKRLATIDRMSGRELHGRQQEWDPTHTIHLATNHLPEVDDASEGFWRRIALIPWKVRFAKAGETGDLPREDPGLWEVLRAEGPGILGWVVAGAVEYGAAGGLHPFPAAVARETAAYRAEEDPLREFLDDYIEPSDDDRAVTTTELHAAYSAWTEAAGLSKAQRLNARRFGRMFAERHGQLGWAAERTTVGGRTAYRGLRVRSVPSPRSTAPGSDDGFGGSQQRNPGISHMAKESAKTGDMPSGPTKATEVAWDKALAERATDDGEASV